MDFVMMVFYGIYEDEEGNVYLLIYGVKNLILMRVIVKLLMKCSPEDLLKTVMEYVTTKWLGDGFCDDGSYEYNGNPIFFNCEEFKNDNGDCDGQGRQTIRVFNKKLL